MFFAFPRTLQANFVNYNGVGIYKESPILSTVLLGPAGTLLFPGYGVSTHAYCISRGIVYGD